LEIEMKFIMRSLTAIFEKNEPTAFHRCLAVHMHFATASGALS
jgi:hypothetical protein